MSNTIEYKTTKENFLDIQEEMKQESKTEIDIDKIILGSNIREDYNLESLKELQESIKSYGQLQPVGINQKNELIYGFRRYKAIKALGRKTIKVVLIDPSLSTSKVTIQIIENLQREDLNAYEYSKAIQELVKELKDKFPYPLVSKALKKKPTWIQDRLNYKNEIERLEKNPSLSTSKVKDNLSVNEHKELASLKDEKKIPLIQEIIKSKTEGKPKTIKEIREKASSHKEIGESSREFSDEDSKLRTLAIRKFDKKEKLSHPEKKILKSFFSEEIARRKKEISELNKEVNEFRKKLGRVK